MLADLWVVRTVWEQKRVKNTWCQERHDEGEWRPAALQEIRKKIKT